MLSLNARLLLAASLVLLGFFGLTGYALDQAFRDSALVAVQERLQAQVYMLLGAAEFTDTGRLALPNGLPEARFSIPGSGLYAGVLNDEGDTLWRSLSMLGMEPVSLPVIALPGQAVFTEVPGHDSGPLLLLNFTVNWERGPDEFRRYTFWVAEDQRVFSEQVDGFRRSLGGWLLAAALVLLTAQGLILRWSLRPLRRVAAQVQEIENGRRSHLDGPYPAELRPLTDNLNTLIHQSRSLLERYRNALGDLAHSLKTPLAVLQGALDNRGSDEFFQHLLEEQLGRMRQTVDYQLQRAAASGRTALTAPVVVGPVVDKVLNSLAKVYADKKLHFVAEVEAGLSVRVDEGDLLEILGNLADNACKWAASRVSVRATSLDERLVLEVLDDGPGIPAEQRRVLMHRGQRADSQVEGQGIGLAVVRELVEEIYQGNLQIFGEPGTRVRAEFPA